MDAQGLRCGCYRIGGVPYNICPFPSGIIILSCWLIEKGIPPRPPPTSKKVRKSDVSDHAAMRWTLRPSGHCRNLASQWRYEPISQYRRRVPRCQLQIQTRSSARRQGVSCQQTLARSRRRTTGEVPGAEHGLGRRLRGRRTDLDVRDGRSPRQRRFMVRPCDEDDYPSGSIIGGQFSARMGPSAVRAQRTEGLWMVDQPLPPLFSQEFREMPIRWSYGSQGARVFIRSLLPDELAELSTAGRGNVKVGRDPPALRHLPPTPPLPMNDNARRCGCDR
jgi:hypothetical protein